MRSISTVWKDPLIDSTSADPAINASILSSVKQKISRIPFLIKLTNWEFWPFNVLYLPAFFYYAYLIIRARTPFYFSTSNPGLENAGMLGESKFRLYNQIDKSIQPKTLFFEAQSSLESVLSEVDILKLSFPLIAKPDVGERGSGVEKIKDKEELKRYISGSKINFLIQEFIDLPIELGIFYYKYPGQEKGTVSSVTQKGFLQIIGDGESTIEQLIKKNKRALLQWDKLVKRFGASFQEIPSNGEVLMLEEIGNHCRGTAFLDRNHEIDQKLTDAFDHLASGIDGFYFGRFDLRCLSFDELRDLKNFKIIELNGAGGEPGHIYHPGASLWNAYRVIFHHMKVMFEISRKNKELGNPYMTLKEGVGLWRRVRKYNKLRSL
ncbi:MAG: hypothetical protein AAF363_01650 [Bacteroidota bacterium]